MKVRQGNILTKKLSMMRAVELMFSTLSELTNDGGYPLAWFEKPSLRVVIHPMTDLRVRKEIQKYLVQGRLA